MHEFFYIGGFADREQVAGSVFIDLVCRHVGQQRLPPLNCLLFDVKQFARTDQVAENLF